MTQTYVDFAVDIESALLNNSDGSLFRIANDNLEFKYSAKFAVIQKDTLNSLYLKVLQEYKYYIPFKKAKENNDSILTLFDELFSLYSSSLTEIKGKESLFKQDLNNKTTPEIIERISRSFLFISNLNRSLSVISKDLQSQKKLLTFTLPSNLNNMIDTLSSNVEDYQNYLEDQNKFYKLQDTLLIHNYIKDKDFNIFTLGIHLRESSLFLDNVKIDLEDDLRKKRIDLQNIVLEYLK